MGSFSSSNLGQVMVRSCLYPVNAIGNTKVGHDWFEKVRHGESITTMGTEIRVLKYSYRKGY